MRASISVWVSCSLLLVGSLSAQSTGAADPEPSNGGGADALIRSLVLATLPREYENTKHWGQTKPRWDGLHVSLDGLRIKTKRKWQEVNHGTWTRYKATLVDPERQLQIHSGNMRQTEDQRVAFDLTVDAQLALSGRLSEWQLGVQLYSFSAEADATVRLTLTCETKLVFDTARFPPDVLLVPRVTNAELDLREFHLHRISEADGPLVRKLSHGLQDVLQDEINDRRQQLVDKINRTISKHSGKLRLSLHDLPLTGWAKTVSQPANPN